MLLPTWAALLALAAPPEPVVELVILPPKPQDTTKPETAMAVWKLVVAEVDKAKGPLGISLTLQNDAKAALAGPARDQGWECKDDAECLADLGSTMGAQLLVAGAVDKESVSLMVVDVKARTRIVAARTAKKLEAAGWQRQTKAAVKSVLGVLEKWRTAPKVDAPPPPEAKIDPSTAEIRLSAADLAQVKELTIDGLPIPRSKDGAIAWSGVPGRHVVVAVRADGQRAVHELTLDGGKSQSVALVFGAPPSAPPAPPPPAPPPAGTAEPQPAIVAAPPPPPSKDDDEKASPWWVWVAVGGAVVAGGTTAALLALGSKGGPSADSGTGAITGTY